MSYANVVAGVMAVGSSPIEDADQEMTDAERRAKRSREGDDSGDEGSSSISLAQDVPLAQEAREKWFGYSNGTDFEKCHRWVRNEKVWVFRCRWCKSEDSGKNAVKRLTEHLKGCMARRAGIGMEGGGKNN
jgi:hypothetical protein